MSRAAIISDAGKPVETVEIAVPEMEFGSVLVETVFSEVCGTDVRLQHGRLAGVPYPHHPRTRLK